MNEVVSITTDSEQLPESKLSHQSLRLLKQTNHEIRDSLKKNWKISNSALSGTCIKIFLLKHCKMQMGRGSSLCFNLIPGLSPAFQKQLQSGLPSSLPLFHSELLFVLVCDGNKTECSKSFCIGFTAWFCRQCAVQTWITIPVRSCWIQSPSSFIWLRTGCRFFLFFNLSNSQFTQEMSICWLLLLFLCSELQSLWKTRLARACVYKLGFKSGLDSLFQLSKWLICSLQQSFLLRRAVGCVPVPCSGCCMFTRTLEAHPAVPWR